MLNSFVAPCACTEALRYGGKVGGDARLGVAGASERLKFATVVLIASTGAELWGGQTGHGPP